ncbi:iron-containing alcohol dehydrogenase [Pikeienuella piscinae]|uniref:Iron-containing alcohol dehydrogenase n=1 Tax=Pikeienuella piscinae TaxID=2748098 RepID=A0A7L5BZ65_9RHOB|nr:iron-containing alcohol dehydrogenase [Pikeienuella piscinae]QIE55807.1 iron-containing alcohol dehydrogenase [Pikeienuella piscinae]
MTLINYLTRVHFADGVLEEALWGEMSERGRRRPLIVAGPKGPACDAMERLLAALPIKTDAAFFSGCPRFPHEAAARRLAAEYSATERDSLIAFGDRAAINFAKIARLAAADGRPLADLARGGEPKLADAAPDLIAIPTIRGYGASVSAFASVVTLDERRALLATRLLIPSVAICDPTLTLDADAGESASAGAEAFAACVEAYLARGYNPPAEGIALDGLRRAVRSLHNALRSGALADRRELSAASLNGALAQQKGPGLAYALVNALCAVSSAAPDSGAVSRLVLPGVLRMIGADPEHRAGAQRGETVRALLGLDAGADLAEGVRRFMAPLPLPASLSEMGVSLAEIGRAAEEAARDLAAARNATPARGEELRSLLRAVH